MTFEVISAVTQTFVNSTCLVLRFVV